MKYVWHVWLSAVAVSFALLEARALRVHGESATLTAHLRRTLGIHPRRRFCTGGRVLMISVFGWCILHLCFGVLPREGWFQR